VLFVIARFGALEVARQGWLDSAAADPRAFPPWQLTSMKWQDYTPSCVLQRRSDFFGRGFFSTALIMVGAIAVSAAFVSPATAAPATFRHPGVVTNEAMLDFTKAKIQAHAEPWTTAFNTMTNDPLGSLTYVAKPWQTVECGSSSNPNKGCTDERKDAMAAYTQALLWYYTGNSAYAKNAIKIMNAWAAKLTGGHINSNAPLQTGWSGAVWPQAAEIIAHTYPGWASADLAKFKTMLKTQYVPTLSKGSCANGNWEAVMVEALINISVFLEDRSSYDRAVSLWRSRTPAYIYLTIDGSSPKAPATCSKPNWYGLTTFVDGVAQETCRDFGHCSWGINALVLTAETALQQGQDLYSENNQRFLKTLEFHCTYLNGTKAPSWLCDGSPSLGYTQGFEVAFNHLTNRLGKTMPQTAKFLATKRPTKTNYFVGWETITHYGQGWNGLK
jgi:hypothetical protein